MGEEGCDFCVPHILGMALVVKEDVAFDPTNVGLFGADGVMFEANGIADLIE